MKNITKSLLILLGAFAVSCSSDDVEDRSVITPVGAPVLTAPDGGSYVLTSDAAAEQADRFVWTSADFDEDVAITYTLELDKAGNSFADPKSLGSVAGQNSLSVSVESLNNAAIATGAEAFESAQFEVRVKASVNDTFEPMYSEAITIGITPFSTVAPRLWVPGGYQSTSGYGGDWNHGTAPQLVAAAAGSTEFEGYMYLATDQLDIANSQGFKFTSSPDWNGTIYGGAAGTISTSGDNIPSEAGYYLVKVNTDPEEMSYSLTETQWGVVGNATPGGWDNSTPMTYDAATKKWSVTVELVPQAAPDHGFKFRANNAWDLNLGDTSLNSTDGTLSYGGTNIGVAAAGTYLITLDLSNPRAYTYTITQQ